MKKILLTLIFSFTASIYAAHGNNHRLAGDIFLGISEILRPAPVVVTPPPAPVIVQQPVVQPVPVVTPVAQPIVAQPVVQPIVTPVTQPVIPAYSYSIYNGISCPTYNGYYYYNNTWVWGGGPILHRPPAPIWIPHARPIPHGPIQPHRPIPPGHIRH